MLSYPKLGQCVQVWYNAKLAAFMPLHGLTGEIVAVSKGRPRNHGVSIAGRVYAVPAGNLRPGKDDSAAIAQVRVAPRRRQKNMDSGQVHEFAPGDVVRSKVDGGRTLMSVKSVTPHPDPEMGLLVECSWRDEEDAPKLDIFNASDLELA